jgi:hypothetical protein
MTLRLCFFALALPLMGLVEAGETRVFELRTYVTNEGKLPDLLARFRDHTCALFAKHGMENIGYWVPMDESDGSANTLIYLLAHANREAAQQSWKGFAADADWQKARAASEANGKILAKAPESVFLRMADFSPPLPGTVGPGDRVFELRIYRTPPGKLAALHARFRDHTLQLFSKHGMTHIGYWNPVDAEKGAEDTLIYLLAHASREAAAQSFAAFRSDPDWIAAKAASEKDGSLTVQPGGVKSIFLKPTSFSVLK